MANIQISSGQYDQAIDNARHVLAKNPTFPFALELWGRAEVQKGDVAAGIARLENDRDRNEGWLGYAYAVSGRRGEAEDLLQRNATLPQRQALICAGLGDKDGAFEALEQLATLNAGRAGAVPARTPKWRSCAATRAWRPSARNWGFRREVLRGSNLSNLTSPLLPPLEQCAVGR